MPIKRAEWVANLRYCSTCHYCLEYNIVEILSLATHHRYRRARVCSWLVSKFLHRINITETPGPSHVYSGTNSVRDMCSEEHTPWANTGPVSTGHVLCINIIMDMAAGLSLLILLVLSSCMLFHAGRVINGSWTQEATPPVKEEARNLESVQWTLWCFREGDIFLT